MSLLVLIRHRINRFTDVPYWSLSGILYITSPPAVRVLEGMEGVIVKDVRCHTPFSLVLDESGAVGERGEIIAHPGTFLLWVSWVLGTILSSGLVARSPCSR